MKTRSFRERDGETSRDLMPSLSEYLILEPHANASALRYRYSTWPWPIMNLAPNVKQQLAFLAAQRVYARPMLIDEVTHGNTVTYQTKVHYIDAATGAHGRFTVSATATEAAVGHIAVPDLPSFSVLRPASGVITPVISQAPYHVALSNFSKKKVGQTAAQRNGFPTAAIRARTLRDEMCQWYHWLSKTSLH